MSDTTKRALAASLKKLLERQTLSKITVKDIVDNCGVNRQTFYYHFHDVYDLMEWIFDDETEIFLMEKVDTESWDKTINDIFRYMKDNRAFIVNVCHSLNRETLEQYLFRRIYTVIAAYAKKELKGAVVNADDFDFLVRFYSFALIGFGMEWANQGMKEDNNEKLAKYFVLMYGSFPQELQRMAEKKEKNPF